MIILLWYWVTCDPKGEHTISLVFWTYFTAINNWFTHYILHTWGKYSSFTLMHIWQSYVVIRDICLPGCPAVKVYITILVLLLRHRPKIMKIANSIFPLMQQLSLYFIHIWISHILCYLYVSYTKLKIIFSCLSHIIIIFLTKILLWLMILKVNIPYP